MCGDTFQEGKDGYCFQPEQSIAWCLSYSGEREANLHSWLLGSLAV